MSEVFLTRLRGATTRTPASKEAEAAFPSDTCLTTGSTSVGSACGGEYP